MSLKQRAQMNTEEQRLTAENLQSILLLKISKMTAGQPKYTTEELKRMDDAVTKEIFRMTQSEELTNKIIKFFNDSVQLDEDLKVILNELEKIKASSNM